MEDFNNKIENALPALRKHAAIEGKKNNTDPEDLLQRVVVKAILKKDEFDGRYFEAWIKRMMTNLAIDDFRKEHRVIPIDEIKDVKNLEKVWGPKSIWKIKKFTKKINAKTINSNETENESHEDILSDPSHKKEREEYENEEKEEQINQLINSIRKLSKNCQEILRAYLKGAEVSSQKELAERLSIPPGTVASRLQRCLISLKNIVKKLPEFNQE